MEVPMESGVQLDLGKGPSKVGPMSQPRRYHRSHVTHTGSYLRSMALSEPTLIWAAKVDLYPHIGGTVSYQARYIGICMGTRQLNSGSRRIFEK